MPEPRATVRGELARRIIPLTLGAETLPRSVSILGDRTGQLITEPVTAVLVETSAGWVLLDTGHNPALVRDPALAERFYRGADKPLLATGGDPLEDTCHEAGVELDDIVLVAVSHLHSDHAGGLRHFARRATPVAIQGAELQHAMETPQADLELQGIFRIDFDDPSLNWQVLDGDTRIAPGVTAICTPGHTPGHQSFLVELDGAACGGYAFAFDAADLTENIDREIAPGGLIGGTPEQAISSIRRLKSEAAARGLVTVPGHDPYAWPALVDELSAEPTAPAPPAGPTASPSLDPLIHGRPALVIVDMQQAGYLTSSGHGRYGIQQMPGFSDRIRRLVEILELCRHTNVPVVHLQEVHSRALDDFGRELDGAEGVHFIEGDAATSIVGELRPLATETQIVKRRYSGFFGTDLLDRLADLDVSTLLLAGELTDVCVHYTFVDAHQHDFHVRVIEDCCGGSTPQSHYAALDAMEYLQSRARCTAATVTAALISSDHERKGASS